MHFDQLLFFSGLYHNPQRNATVSGCWLTHAAGLVWEGELRYEPRKPFDEANAIHFPEHTTLRRQLVASEGRMNPQIPKVSCCS